MSKPDYTFNTPTKRAYLEYRNYVHTVRVLNTHSAIDTSPPKRWIPGVGSIHRAERLQREKEEYRLRHIRLCAQRSQLDASSLPSLSTAFGPSPTKGCRSPTHSSRYGVVDPPKTIEQTEAHLDTRKKEDPDIVERFASYCADLSPERSHEVLLDVTKRSEERRLLSLYRSPH